MTTTTDPVAVRRTAPGKLLAWLGLAVVVLGVAAYMVQVFVFHRLTTPWYVPIAASIGAGLLILSLVQARTVWRVLGVILCVLLAGLEWYFVVWLSKLPPYNGPVEAGKPFPAFTTTLADGSPLKQDDLAGKKTVMVFFRGRW
jgi:hypothetical protein